MKQITKLKSYNAVNILHNSKALLILLITENIPNVQTGNENIFANKVVL
jgi:hypothetical protein